MIKCFVKKVEKWLLKIKQWSRIQEPVVDTINIESFRRIVHTMMDRYPNEDEIELFYKYANETTLLDALSDTSDPIPSLVD